MPRVVGRTAVLESLDRVANAAGRDYATDVRVLRRVVQEALPAYDAPGSYSAPEAAENLKVTLPTIHAWLRAGVLTTSADSRRSRLRLDRERIDAVARRLRDLRRRAPRTRKLRDVLEWLETQDYGDRLRRPRQPEKATGVPWRQALKQAWGPTTSRARQR
ncbi:MAG TPA: hypothetical protein VI056_09045 [Candidatus Limnocylindria bacterium]